MDKILMDHDDVYVSATVVYVSTSGGEDRAFAYKDEDHTEIFTRAELEEAFLKGVVLKRGRDWMTPIFYTPGEGIYYNYWIGAEQCYNYAKPIDWED